MSDVPIPPENPAAADGVTPASIDAYVAEVWPDASGTECLEVSGRHALIRRRVVPETIRPGGFVSGPTQFSIADAALWYALFGAVGLEAMALTSELSIRFVRPAIGTQLMARARLESVGRRNVVGTITVWTDDESRPSAICQGTYVRPQTAD